MVMRRAAAVRISFGMGALAVMLGIVAGLFGSTARVSAFEPAFVMYGSVTAENGVLPSRVVATIGETTCGSTAVSKMDDGKGFYALAVVSADAKVGCGVLGSLVRVSVLRGDIGPGSPVLYAVFQPGVVSRQNFSAVPLAGAFVGALPDEAGEALLWWTGNSATPIAEALATIGRDVASVGFWDGSRQLYRQYVPGAPAAVQTYTQVDMDDVVILRLR